MKVGDKVIIKDGGCLFCSCDNWAKSDLTLEYDRFRYGNKSIKYVEYSPEGEKLYSSRLGTVIAVNFYEMHLIRPKIICAVQTDSGEIYFLEDIHLVKVVD